MPGMTPGMPGGGMGMLPMMMMPGMMGMPGLGGAAPGAAAPWEDDGAGPRAVPKPRSPEEEQRAAIRELRSDFPDLPESELAVLAAERRLGRAARRQKKGPGVRMADLAPAERQRRVLEDLLKEFPDKPIEELAAMATRRLEGAPEAPAAAAAAAEFDDGEMLRKLMKQHPDKSPAELAVVAARLMAARASRKQRSTDRARNDVLDADSTDALAAAGVEETKGEPEEAPVPELRPVDREAMAAFSKISGGGDAPGVDDLRGLLVRTMQPGAFDDPAKPAAPLLGSMERIGAAGVAAVEQREREQRALAGGAGAALRPKPPKGSDAMHGRMLARMLRRSSPDVQLIIRHPGLWERWLVKLEVKGFFDGADEGTPEFDARMHAALRKFARSPAVLAFGRSEASATFSPQLTTL